MIPRVEHVRHLKEHEVEVRFSDGTVAALDLGRRIRGRGGVFAPLQNVEFFARVSVDPEAGTLVWPNGVDLCPDVLYAEATGKDISALGNELTVLASASPATANVGTTRL